jgi:hypothetical protein
MAPVKTNDDRLNDAMEIIRKKNAELNAANQTIRQIRRDNDTQEIIRTKIYGLSAHTPEPPKWITGPGGASGKRGCPVTIWSDWHYGEVVNPDDVGGVNEFNAKVAKKRVHKLVDTTIDLSYNHMGRSAQKYPGAVIMLGGDMITGDIHEELQNTNDRTPQEAINDLTDILAASLDKMASSFGKLFVPCVVGNHGRSTRKPRMKGRVHTNYEWNIYCNLEREFRKTKNIQFLVSGEADAYFAVFGHRYLLTHGDSLGVKGGDGIIGALGPILRGALKVGRSEAEIGRHFDTLVMGHWHQYVSLSGIIVNNSLMGLNEYGHLGLRAPNTKPSQALWFNHPEHGITARWEVFLEPKKVSQGEKVWVSWQE